MDMLQLKREARVVGVDDGPYNRGSKYSTIILTVYRLDGYVDAFLKGSIRTDGYDSSTVIAGLLEESSQLDQTRCILSDGACLAGFNVLDIDDLHKRTDVPVITVSDSPPDTASFREALSNNFSDWERRLETVTRHRPVRFDLPDGACYMRFVGIDRESAREVVRRSTVHGKTPEPIRLSHMVAYVANTDPEAYG
jgi:hypothetical protein